MSNEALKRELYGHYIESCEKAEETPGFYYREAEESGLVGVYNLGLERGRQEEQKTIYIRWYNGGDSWNAVSSIKSIHLTLEGALEAIDERLKRIPSMKREPRSNSWNGNIVVDYTYEYIEERVIGA